MTLVQRHIARCRHDHPVLCATVGLGVYGALALAVLAGWALSAARP